MKERLETINIGIFDSGIGGIAVLRKLYNQINFDKLYYLTDNKNLPFGNKSKWELLRIVINNVDLMISKGVNIVVFACNTITTSLLEDVKRLYDIKFFGVYPPLDKSYILDLQTNTKSVLLATEGTVNALKKNKIDIDYYGLKNLASDIEKNAFNLSKINLKSHISDLSKYSRIILGCTHYELIEKNFEKNFNAEIVSGSDFTVESIKKYIHNFKNINRKKEIIFIGDESEKNYKFFKNVEKI